MIAADRLRRLDAAMTEGPWEADDTSDSTNDLFDDGEEHSTGWFRRGPGQVDLGDYSTFTWADAEGIATLRNALPELVALVEAAEAVNDAAQRHDPFTGARADMALCAALLDLSGRLGEEANR